MIWANIHYFWIILMLPVMAVIILMSYAQFKRSREAFYPEALKTKLGLVFSKAGPGVEIVFTLIILLSITFSILRPQHGFEEVEIIKKGIDIYVLVDTSRSMRAEDIKPSRMERAKRKLSDLLGYLGGDRVGLIPFAGNAFVSCPLTSDYEAFRLFIGELDTDTIPQAGTNLEEALNLAIKSFGNEAGHARAILLLTDGEETYGKMGNVFEAMKEKEIKLYVLGIGTTEGAPIPDDAGGFKKTDKGDVVLSKLEEESLKNLAHEGDGAYIRTTTSDGDVTALVTQGIRKQLKDAEYGSSVKRIPHEYFQVPLGVACVLFLLLLLKNIKRKDIIVSFLLPLLLLISTTSHAYDFIKKDDPALRAYNAGTEAYGRDDYEGAKKHFLEALNLASNKGMQEKALYNLGNTQYRLKDNDGAIESYSKALELDADYKKAALNKEFVEKQRKSEDEKKDKQEDKQNDKQDENKNQDQEENKKDDQKKDEQENKSGENKEDDKKSDKEQDQSNNENKQDGESKDKENKAGEPSQEKKNEIPPKEDESKSGNELDGSKNDLHNEPLAGGQGQKAEGNPDMTKDKAIYWLESIDDSPKEAMKKMMMKEKGKPQKVEKDW